MEPAAIKPPDAVFRAIAPWSTRAPRGDGRKARREVLQRASGAENQPPPEVVDAAGAHVAAKTRQQAPNVDSLVVHVVPQGTEGPVVARVVVVTTTDPRLRGSMVETRRIESTGDPPTMRLLRTLAPNDAAPLSPLPSGPPPTPRRRRSAAVAWRIPYTTLYLVARRR